MDEDEFRPIPPFCKGCGSENIKGAWLYCPWCQKELTRIEKTWK